MAQLFARTWRSAACAWLIASSTLSAQTPRDRITAPQSVGTATITGRMTIATPQGIQPIRRARVVLEGGTASVTLTIK